jgi:acyl transferase domain-containing protein
MSQAASGIAIVGLACRFPGAVNADEFWRNLCAGVESLAPLSDAELRSAGVPEPLRRDPAYVKAGGVLRDHDRFDAGLFQISPREAALMDPQQRIFLECAWEALEDAACDASTYRGSIGLFAGSGGNLAAYALAHADAFREHLGGTGSVAHLATDKDFLASRVSYKLNLRGPSVVVQTACSTSLVAVHLACQSLLTGECDVALAGGVTVRVPHHAGYLYEDGNILSPDGHCRAFSAKAQGTVFGSGVGVVVLKPLARALRDRDRIYAVIKGSAINNDGGDKLSYTASSVEGQARAIAEALAVADIAPNTVSYVEAHGTGTYLGDPLEVEALSRAFRSPSPRADRCALGSAKSNIGHVEAAAGVAGLIKTALALHHGRLPATLHAETPNPRIDWTANGFALQTNPGDWPASATPRRAGVNSLGIGGTNAFVVLEEAPALPSMAPPAARPDHLFCLSAHSEPALQALVERYEQWLEANADADLGDLCYTAAVGRTHLRHRLALSATSIAELLEQVKAIACGLPPATPLDETARLYLTGESVDWAVHFGRDVTHRKLRLPTYPFQRQRYWITDLKSSSGNVAHSLHECSDSRSESATMGLALKLGRVSEPYLADHRLYGEVVVPGARFVALALAAARKRCGDGVLTLEGCAFARVLTLGREDRLVELTLDDAKSASTPYRIASREGSQTTLHATGAIASTRLSDRPEAIAPQAFQAGRAERTSDALYRRYGELDLDLGPAFRAVRRLWVGPGEIFAEIEASAGLNVAEHEIHPALLDASFQVGMAAAQSFDELFIPWEIERVTLFARPGSHFFCRAAVRDGENRETLTLDLDLLSMTGEALAQIEGLTLKRASRQAVFRAPASSGGLRLRTRERGLLQNLHLDTIPCPPPGPNEVQIAIRAAGLNFRDVLNALGLYPGDPGAFGMECVGVVTAVGEEVDTLQVGQSVFGFARDCFGEAVNVHASLLVPKPEELTFEQAAGIPVVFATAHLALSRLAKVKSGERVLIHAAAGGVGLAALQIARRAGAVVLATASVPKWDYLRSLGVEHVFDSRSLDFAEQIKNVTDGRGADVVLNSLAGDFIARSVDVLAPGGRFLEIGKQGIWSAEQMRAARPDIDYRVIALDRMIEDAPMAAGALLEELVPLFAASDLHPGVHTIFPLSQSAAAFRLMQQARHIGKIILAVSGRMPQRLPLERARPVNLLASVQAASTEVRPALVRDYLQTQVARLLALDPGRALDPATPFVEIGLDSLMTVELRNQLKADLGTGVPLSPSLLYDFPTITALTRHLCEVLGERRGAA